MKLSEARRRYIGKKFRIKHAERGTYRSYIIEGVVGTCTAIEAYWYGTLKDQSDPNAGIVGKKWHFKYRIETPGLHDKWFSASEIELLKEDHEG